CVSLLAALLASLVWSLNPAVISRYGRSLKPLTFTGLRALIAVAPLLALIPFRPVALNATPYGWLVIALSALLGPGLGDSLYTLSIKSVGGSLAVTVSYTYIYFTQLFSLTMAGETVSLKTALGGVLAFTGIAVATIGSNNSRGQGKLATGILAGLGAGVLWGLATTLVKISLRFLPDVVSLTVVRLVLIALFLTPAGYVLEGWYDRRSFRDVIKAGLVTGILGWTFGMYLFIYSINTVGASLTAIATAFTPVLSQFTTRLVSRERVALNHVLGSIAVSLGVALNYV
ncbi:MAG: DMT family transporter, partial [Thermogladius sp.]